MKNKVSLLAKAALLKEAWTPKVVAELNDYQVKLALLEGEFVWHKHDDTDELFLCVQGGFELAFRDHSVHLKEGDLYVVPKGVEHKPIAPEPCTVLLIEPSGVINTGDAESGELTAPNDDWI